MGPAKDVFTSKTKNYFHFKGEAKRFYCLARAMVNKKRLAIVRRVYRDNTAPKMGLLIPHLDVPGEPWVNQKLKLKIFHLNSRFTFL